jgi:hypothetical protein
MDGTTAPRSLSFWHAPSDSFVLSYFPITEFVLCILILFFVSRIVRTRCSPTMGMLSSHDKDTEISGTLPGFSSRLSRWFEEGVNSGRTNWNLKHTPKIYHTWKLKLVLDRWTRIFENLRQQNVYACLTNTLLKCLLIFQIKQYLITQNVKSTCKYISNLFSYTD